jgi:(p)ppGpp synthase/HD superfamily hydrolase
MLTEEEKSQLQKTLQFIVTEHGEQFRKTTGVPYACHPVEVMQQVARWGIIDFDTYASCLCHDVYEERGRHLETTVKFLIGENAESIVDELTFIPEEGKYKSKEEYMISFAEKSVAAIVVKLADRLCNTKDFQTFDPKYALKYWNKAEPLFSALRLRKDDIEKVYGVKAYSRMIKSFNQQLDSLNFN